MLCDVVERDVASGVVEISLYTVVEKSTNFIVPSAGEPGMHGTDLKATRMRRRHPRWHTRWQLIGRLSDRFLILMHFQLHAAAMFKDIPGLT
jgi:hypothetical protein